MPLQTLRGQYASFLNPGQKQALSTCVTYKSWTLGLDWLNEDESPQTQDQEPNRFEAKNNTAKVKQMPKAQIRRFDTKKTKTKAKLNDQKKSKPKPTAKSKRKKANAKLADKLKVKSNEKSKDQSKVQW